MNNNLLSQTTKQKIGQLGTTKYPLFLSATHDEIDGCKVPKGESLLVTNIEYNWNSSITAYFLHVQTNCLVELTFSNEHKLTNWLKANIELHQL